MRCPDSPASSTSDATNSSCSAAWEDCSQGLCRDVQALLPDPFNPTKLYAVAGSGSLPGGLYRCRGQGQKWRRMFGYRWAVGRCVATPALLGLHCAEVAGGAAALCAAVRVLNRHQQLWQQQCSKSAPRPFLMSCAVIQFCPSHRVLYHVLLCLRCQVLCWHGCLALQQGPADAGVCRQAT